MYPSSLQELIAAFKYLPGIGERTAERLAFSVLEIDNDKINLFSESLSNVKEKIHGCGICNVLTEDDICFVCANGNRDKDIICVVEDAKSVFLLEKLGTFKGYYHVLNGLISPLNGINPEDIGIATLIDRLHEKKFLEIVFAFKPSIEGETTALYIKTILSGNEIKITKLASGVPMGADMEYIDSLTLERALSDRKLVE